MKCGMLSVILFMVGVGVMPAQSLTPIAPVKPTEVVVYPRRAVPIALAIDGGDVQIVAPGLSVVREYDPNQKVLKLSVTGYNWGAYCLTVTTAKDGKLASHCYRVRVAGLPYRLVTSKDILP